MKKLLTIILIGYLPFSSVIKSIGQTPSITKMKGIWQFIPNNKGDSLLAIDLTLFAGNKSIDITYWRKTKKASTSGAPFSYYGFYEPKNQEYPKRLTDLDTSGYHIFFYDDLGRNYDSLGNLFRYRTCGISYNEDEDPNYEPAILRFYYKGIPDVYARVQSIPDSILLALKQNPKSWNNYAAFVGMIQKKVRIQQAVIYRSPDVPSKAYLILGDDVQVLEERKNWYRIRYYGRKVIEGWLRRTDVD